MSITKQSSLEDVARYIMTHLKKNNIYSVLVGGAVVSILTDNKHQSYGLERA